MTLTPRSNHPGSDELSALGAEATGPVPATGWTQSSLILMVVIWGVNMSVVKKALGGFSPNAFNSLRFLLASAFVLAVLRYRGPLRLPDRVDAPRILLLGLAGNVLYQMAFIIGLSQTRAGNTAVILAVMPIFVLLLGIASGERHGGRAWAGVLVSVVGVALVSGTTSRLEGGETLGGDLILVCAAAVWAAYTVAGRPFVEKYGSIQTTAWTLWGGSLGLVPIGVPALLRQDWSRVGAFEWAAVVYSGLLSIGLAYFLWYRGVAQLGGARAAIFSNLTPIVGLAVGAVWLHERVTLLSLLGAAMVIGGVMLVRE